MSDKPEIYISTDIEADGPIPGMNSMLSFGSAAYLADKTLVSTFSTNLETLPGAVSDPKTMEWWRGQPEAWAACRENPQPPEKAIKDYLAWLKGLPGIPVFVSYPPAYDFLFVYWYLIRFTGESPFSHSALDIKTFAMALMKTPYRQSTKKNMPKEWFDKLPHSHQALDDAKEQGALFCNMLTKVLNLGGMKIPGNTKLPFFAYGIFKPGELGFLQLKDLTENLKENQKIKGDLRVRDGLPILDPNGEGLVEGSLIWFKQERVEEAYNRIKEIGPEKQYRCKRSANRIFRGMGDDAISVPR